MDPATLLLEEKESCEREREREEDQRSDIALALELVE